MKTFLKRLKNDHIFLFGSLIVSFVISLLFYIVCIFAVDSFIGGLIYFIPPILLLLIVILSLKIYVRYPKLTKIFMFLFNSFIILFVQIFMGLSILIVMIIFQPEKNYNNPRDYEKALDSIYKKERIAHFPKSIPAEAENIELSKYSNNWFGSEELVIKFSINKKYIEDELKKYKFISVENPDNSEYNPERRFYGGDISIKGFTFYVISDKKNDIPNEHSFLYHYGIGVNKDFSKIIYYYICPD